MEKNSPQLTIEDKLNIGVEIPKNLKSLSNKIFEEIIELNEKEYVDILLKIARDYLPIIRKHNIHLHDNIRSAIELVLDQSYSNNMNQMEISEETIKDVDDIINTIQQEG